MSKAGSKRVSTWHMVRNAIEDVGLKHTKNMWCANSWDQKMYDEMTDAVMCFIKASRVKKGSENDEK